MNTQQAFNAVKAQTLIKNLRRRHFNALYCENKQAAAQAILEIVPNGCTIGWGGSISLDEIGIKDMLHNGDYRVLDRDQKMSFEEKTKLQRAIFSADYFLTSTNAITEDGILVNIDGAGNRVAAITWGPDHVIFVVGMNKLCQDVDAALKRVRSLAAPMNTQRLSRNTPCIKDGLCHNCNSAESICNYIHFTRNSYPSGRHTIILVGESLGY